MRKIMVRFDEAFRSMGVYGENEDYWADWDLFKGKPKALLHNGTVSAYSMVELTAHDLKLGTCPVCGSADIEVSHYEVDSAFGEVVQSRLQCHSCEIDMSGTEL